MASGSKSTNVTSDGLVKILFEWSSVPYASNYSRVTWVLSIKNDSSKNVSSQVTKHNITAIDGNNVFNDYVSINCNADIKRTLVSGVTNITHNANGSKTFTYDVSQNFGPIYYGADIVDVGAKAINGSGILDTIPRPSVLGTISDFTIGSAITIPITKYNNDFSDTLNIYVGDTWIKRVQGIVDDDSVSFTTAELDAIYNEMPNVTSAVFRFETTTYSGPTILGTSTKTAKGTINANVKPTISSVGLSEAVGGIAAQFQGYVKGQSKINGTINATGGSGSSIASYKATINGTTYTSGTFTTGSLYSAGSNTCVVVVTDRRGRTATTTVTYNVLDYSIPSLASFDVIRSDASGNYDEDGLFAKVNLSASISAVNNRNTKNFKLEYKKVSEYSWTTYQEYTSSYSYTLTNQLIPISADDPYYFRINITDYFNTDNPAQITKDLSSAFTLMDFKADGTGIGFGGVSTKSGYQFFSNMYDRFDGVIRNGVAFYESQGSTDVDTTLEELCLSSTGTPTPALWYVRTMFYSNKTTSTSRCQVAYPYQNNLIPCFRYFFNGVWSEWVEFGCKPDIYDNRGIVELGNGFYIQWGRLTASVDTAAVTKEITFNFGQPFTTKPQLFVQPVTGVTNACWASISNNTNANQGAFYFYRTAQIATLCDWYAVGKVS